MLLNMLLVAGTACAGLPATDAEYETLDVEAIMAVAAAEPGCWQARWHLGRASLANGDHDAGVTHFQAVTAMQPDNSMAHAWLGNAYLSRAGAESSLGDADDGVGHLEKAIELDPGNLDAREILASFHRVAPWIAGGDMDIADEQAEYIRARDPLRGLLVYSGNRLADGEEDEAITSLHDALEEHPEWDQAALQLGIAYHMTERFDDAFAVLERYAAKDDADPMLVYQLGRTAALSGRFLDEGRAAMRRYIAMVQADGTLDVPPSPAWWRLGEIEQHAGNISAARVAYEKALEHDPENAHAREALRALK